MDKVTFQKLLDSPEQLLALPLSELRQLHLDYPYSPNLSLLLLLRARLEADPTEGDHLARTAATTFDRAHLYDLLRDLDRQQTAGEAQEETLELIGLDEIREERLPAPPSPAPEERLASRLNQQAVDPSPLDPDPPVALPQQPPTPPSQSAPDIAPPPPFSPPDGWSDSAAALLAALPVSSPSPAAPRPERPTRFSRPRPTATPLQRRLRELRNKTLPLSPTAADRSVDRIAHESVVEHAAIASETLAQLLVRQGQYRNAIKMYRRLILLNPDKKAIFAALIKELKEKL